MLNIYQETQGQWRGMWVVVFLNGCRCAYTTYSEAKREAQLDRTMHSLKKYAQH